MEYTFLYEEALAEKGLKKRNLPQAIQDDLKQLVSLCHQLAEMDEEDIAGQEKLNDEIDSLDEKISNDIKSISTDTPPAVTPSTDTPPAPEKEESSSNTGMVVLGLAVVGGLIWGALKLFGGKK